MPGFFDRELRSTWADSFDNSTATSLYWKQVPVILRLRDREEHGCDLTIRIFSGTSHGSHAYRVRASPQGSRASGAEFSCRSRCSGFCSVAEATHGSSS